MSADIALRLGYVQHRWQTEQQTSETTLLIICTYDHICDTQIGYHIDWDVCWLRFLPVQSLYEEVISGTPGPKDPHWSPQGQEWG